MTSARKSLAGTTQIDDAPRIIADVVQAHRILGWIEEGYRSRTIHDLITYSALTD
jgi:hypothetical protein